MSNNEISLKQKNAPYLWSFFCFNLTVFLIVFYSIYIDALSENYKALFTLRTLGISIAPLLLFVVNGLLTSNQKAIIVFWRLKNVLPGNRAFSVHALEDDRINYGLLKKLYPDIPVNAKQQNNLWYKIYKTHCEEITVKKSHKDFLLGRDLASLSFLFLLFIGFPVFFLSDLFYKWYYIILLIVQYLIMVRLAQNHGRKLVKNVLALESIK